MYILYTEDSIIAIPNQEDLYAVVKDMKNKTWGLPWKELLKTSWKWTPTEEIWKHPPDTTPYDIAYSEGLGTGKS